MRKAKDWGKHWRTFIWMLLLTLMFSVKSEAADLQITMLDVGQGLSLLCESDGEYMLYDGGGRDSSSYVTAYLQQHGITQLKYVVVSHYDEDHIAGLIGVFYTTEVDQVLSPDYEADTAIYSSYLKAVSEREIKTVHPAQGDSYYLGSASFQILGPVSYTASDNDNSLAVRLDAEGFSAVITGDAETEEEAAIVDSGSRVACDLYVAGHHGSSSSSSGYLLDAMQPAAAFISVGADNSYGHPTSQTLEAFAERGIEVYRSDLMGEVACSVENGAVSYFAEHAEKNADDITHQTESSGNSLSSQSYILNTNTMKFHYADCPSVQQMKDKNKQEYSGGRDEIIRMGYDPCGNCHP